MVVLNKIYTRTGDSGTTALGDGSRVAKHSIRVEAYGSVDETNATLGMAQLHAEGDVAEAIERVQNDLFDLGADLCTPEQENPEYPPLRISEDQVTRLENEIDAWNANIPPLRSFILPGGSALAAHLHLSRTVSRRAERLMVALSEHVQINPHALKYINRLSDWLFVLGRHSNNQGADDVLWTPGANR